MNVRSIDSMNRLAKHGAILLLLLLARQDVVFDE